MASLFLLLGCNLSCIVDWFAALHELASASAHITKARIIGARALKTLWRHLKAALFCAGIQAPVLGHKCEYSSLLHTFWVELCDRKLCQLRV